MPVASGTSLVKDSAAAPHIPIPIPIPLQILSKALEKWPGLRSPEGISLGIRLSDDATVSFLMGRGDSCGGSARFIGCIIRLFASLVGVASSFSREGEALWARAVTRHPWP